MSKIDSSNERIFKPRYNGRASLALVFWPISAVALVFFTVEMFRTAAYYADGLLVLMFALVTFSPPFIYFRELRFGDALVVKRYFLPDVVIPYQEIVSFQYFSLRSANTRVALSNLKPQSFEELDQIIDQFSRAGKIRIKKRN